MRKFVSKTGKKIGKSIDTIPNGLIEKLERHHWPGNIRELENVVERAVITSETNQLSLADSFGHPEAGPQTSINSTLEEVEKNHILKTLRRCHWKIEGKSGASTLLNVNPSTLRSKMIKLGIHKEASSQ